MSTGKLKKYVIYLPYFIALILFFCLYQYSFPQGDDFTFATRGGTFPRIWDYYLYYYTYAGSRMANLFASFLLLSGMTAWKILTPLVTQGIALLLFYCTTGRITADGGQLKYDFSLSCVCAFFPGLIPLSNHLFADTFLWMDGSCNYLYSLLFFLIGFLPFWNALQNRPLPHAMKWICPFFFVLAGLMHEQIAVALFVFCIFSLIFLRRSKKISRYLIVLTLIAAAIIVFTFTCPGAYYRLNETNQGANSNFLRRVFSNFTAYFSPFSSGLWPVTFLLGICAIAFLRSSSGRAAALLRSFIGFGAVLAPLSHVLALPILVNHSSHTGIKGALLLMFWMLYFIAVLAAFLIPFHKGKKSGTAAALYLCMWGSQAIPAALGSVGRPLLPFAVLTLLLALCVLKGADSGRFFRIQLCVAAVGFCSVLYLFFPVSSNYAAYQKIQRQVAAAVSGHCDTVNFDQQSFNSDYCYFNAFSPAYHYELQQYYRLPKNIKMDFSHHPADSSAPSSSGSK